MLALLAGLAIVIASIPRPWPRARWIGAITSLLLVTGFIFHAQAQTRYGQGLVGEDQSIDSRLIIWRRVPEMLADAPWGWGWGKAGDAYTQWFQPAGQSVNYLNLVSSHFTWMVEGGWAVSVLYLSIWMAVLLLCWPDPQFTAKAIPFAVWVAFGVSGAFSHVEESVGLWILPLMCFVVALGSRFHFRCWPTLLSAGKCAVMALGIVTLVILVGFAKSSLPIRVAKTAVSVGRGPELNIIFVDRNVMGNLYGHAFRRYVAENPHLLDKSMFIITESPDYVIPSGVHELIFSGRLWPNTDSLKLNQADQIVLINPCGLPGSSRWKIGNRFKTCVYFGEYSQSTLRSSWAGYPDLETRFIDGAADFVPSWPQAVLRSPGT
jgi:hypothetical protein